VRSRSCHRKALDFLTFPIRALILHERDRWGLSSLATERFDYVAGYACGYCLDVGCGRRNRFIEEFLAGNGKGIDVFPYEGLTAEQIVEDLSSFPFEDGMFGTVTFIANLNHVPEPLRDTELAESYRVLKTGGRVIVTMGNPVAEVLVHWLIFLCARVFGSKLFTDTERGLRDGEAYFLSSSEIVARLRRAGFRNVTMKYFVTQWWLNHLFLAEKPELEA